MTSDILNVLTALDGSFATKRLHQDEGRRWVSKPYGNAVWFKVRHLPADGIESLHRALVKISLSPHSFVIRGEPKPDADLERCRRLVYAGEDGAPPTFTPCARRWLAIDVDSLPTPQWDPDKLARRRAAILADQKVHQQELEAHDLNDPAPIDPIRDWPLVCLVTTAHLPPEFWEVSCVWQMTSSAGIKPGIRLRLWYWLDRPVSDDEAKRWLKDSPVDLALYNPVQPHYVAAPIFDPPGLDPVPQRWGVYWRLRGNQVRVPDLRPPASPPRPTYREPRAQHTRATRYADAALDAARAAPEGQRHTTMRNVAVKLFSLAQLGELDQGEVRAELLSAMGEGGWPPSRSEKMIAWADARARANPILPDRW